MLCAEQLGFHGECVISHLNANIVERADYWVHQTPNNQGFYFGNFLALKTSLHSQSKTYWQETFKKEFANLAGVKHLTFVWPNMQGDESGVTEYIEAGFDFEQTHILSMQPSDLMIPPVAKSSISFKPITQEPHWQQWIDLHIKEGLGEHNETSFRQYLNAKIENYQKLSALGLGEYLGAFHNNQLIGYAGLFHLHDVARFQHVHVCPNFQNQNIAKNLLAQLIQRAPKKINKLVIFADENYHATQLYQKLGFAITERQCSLCWWRRG